MNIIGTKIVTRASRMVMMVFLFIFIVFYTILPQSYRKSHEEAPDKTENRMPGVVKMLFLCSERDVFANFGEHLRGDAEERGEVLQGKRLNNTGTTLQQ